MRTARTEAESGKWVDLCRRAIRNMQTSSSGPTRSGKQIQVRVSFPWDGKWTTGYHTASRSSVMRMKDGDCVDFKSLLSCALRLHTAMQKAGLERWEADSMFDAVWEELDCDPIKVASEHVRKDIARLMREAVRVADEKRDQVESVKCREQIPRWLLSALKCGLSPEELHEMVGKAVVESVLKS